MPQVAPATLIEDGFVYTADDRNRVHPQGSVLLLGDRIAAVGPSEEVAREVQALDLAGLRRIPAAGKLVLPGFVNPHWHESLGAGLAAADQNPDDTGDAPGPFAEGGDIRALSAVFDAIPARTQTMTPDEALAIARYSIWTQLRSGITTYGDVGSMNHSDALFDATVQLGGRGAVSHWASDMVCPQGTSTPKRTREVAEITDPLRALLDRAAADPSGRLRVMPSAVYVTNMSDDLGTALAELCTAEDLTFATHAGALANEPAVVAEYYGTTPIHRLDRLGLLNERLLSVHTAFVSDSERELLLKSGFKLSHSPGKYGSTGESPISGSKLIVDLMRAGIPVSVSTDGNAYPLGMIETMRMAWLGHNEVWSNETTVRPSTALAMGTRLAARCLRWDDQIGSLEKGKQGDLVLIPATDWRYLLRSRPLDGLLSTGSSNDVDTVLVAGRVLLEDGRSTFLDETELRTRFIDAVTSFTERSR
ncbi:hypothetical protein ALI144C_36050 [Actinosynnema sp. ALI-1.44]|uniref:amidohydrolase family protein n=1 Tax=Actinosynnema sp. ALI-1.44 TaxID=1933779 RepID=UPI00097C3A73|nr:amidohydrolase family protein [Actinosynnema sp. ALI-1.44]ONI76432.1 hypothetical protein ALI144C_36050 [Actinosynnema sp. ALI-1.44]